MLSTTVHNHSDDPQSTDRSRTHSTHMKAHGWACPPQTLPSPSSPAQVRKLYRLSVFILTTIILPRQARDKYRESTHKEERFLAGPPRDDLDGVSLVPFLKHPAQLSFPTTARQGTQNKTLAFSQYLLQRTLVYQPKNLNRDWSPRFSMLRDKTAGFVPKTA